MYRLLEWAFAYDDGSGLPDAGAYAAELKDVTATADGKPVQGFDPTKTGTWTIPAGTPAGEYRLVHYGDSKAPVTGRISAFSGASRSFIVQ